MKVQVASGLVVPNAVISKVKQWLSKAEAEINEYEEKAFKEEIDEQEVPYPYEILSEYAVKYGIEYWSEEDFEYLKENNLIDDYENYEEADYWLNEWDTFCDGSFGGCGIWLIKYNGKTYYIYVEGTWYRGVWPNPPCCVFNASIFAVRE